MNYGRGRAIFNSPFSIFNLSCLRILLSELWGTVLWQNKLHWFAGTQRKIFLLHASRRDLAENLPASCKIAGTQQKIFCLPVKLRERSGKSFGFLRVAWTQR
jgi:hypothetical protein